MAVEVQEPKIFRKDRYFYSTGYHPHAAQIPVHTSTVRHRALSNGRRWGKTLLGAKEAEATAWVMNRLKQAQRGWIVGPNYSDCEKEYRVIYDSLKKLGVEELSNRFVSNVESGNMQISTKWGWDIQCRSAAHPESLVGEGLDFVLLVEAGRLRRKTFTEYIRPALSDKRGWSLMTGVPEIATDVSLLYWGWSRGQDPGRPAWESWRMPSWTNLVTFPGGRTDPEILEAEDDLTTDEFDRQYGGMFVERVGLVMQEWDEEVHVAAIKFNPEWPLYAGIDFGYTNPFVWLWIQVDPFDNVYVIGEHYITFQDVPEIVNNTLKDHPWMRHLVAMYPDPAAPDDINILERMLKKPARRNTGGELKHRLGAIRRKLKPGPHSVPEEHRKPSLWVDFSCRKLIWEMGTGYRWPEKKDDAPRNDAEQPQDKDNHGPEALGRFFKGHFDMVEPKRARSRVSQLIVRR